MPLYDQYTSALTKSALWTPRRNRKSVKAVNARVSREQKRLGDLVSLANSVSMNPEETSEKERKPLSNIKRRLSRTKGKVNYRVDLGSHAFRKSMRSLTAHKMTRQLSKNYAV